MIAGRVGLATAYEFRRIFDFAAAGTGLGLRHVFVSFPQAGMGPGTSWPVACLPNWMC